MTYRDAAVTTLTMLFATFISLPAPLFAQASIEGKVLNGTTNRPVANQELHLMMARGGMQHVAATKSDAAGRFVFSGDIDSKSFYLISTEFHDVSYNAPVSFDPSGAARVNLTLFDSTRSPAGVRIPAVEMLAGAEKNELRVQEQYAVQNASNPPRAYLAPGATLSFQIPADAGTPSVSVNGLMNMVLPQTPVAGKTPGEFSIHYPFKPGVTAVTVQYARPYQASGVELRDGASFPIDQAELYVYPSSLAVAAPGFRPAGVDNPHQIAKYQAQRLPGTSSSLSIRVSGDAALGPPPGSEAPNAGAGQANGEANQNGGQQEVKILPNSVSRLTPAVLGGFLILLLWALGVRVARDWPTDKTGAKGSPDDSPLGPQGEKLLNSIADLDELFAAGKLAEPKYWKERLELKARLVAVLKKSPPALLESYAARHHSG